jgi:GNAT superfamily N-acetyltransferase
LGYYSLGDAPEDQNYLWHLYVDPAVQRQGIGGLLHAAALNELRGRGCREARLDCVAGNQKAARFYARHGWTEIGRDSVDGLDLIFMRREI